MDCTAIECLDPSLIVPTLICLVFRRLIMASFYGKREQATIEKQVGRFAPAFGFWLLVVS